MKKHETKKVNQTFSIPVDISNDLHAFVKKREMSQFVSEAIRKELFSKKNDLKKHYLAANEDEGQTEEMNNWEGTLEDGSGDW
ncbi:MAG: hypothetical protein HW387_1755 [Parachlamydiales bacterium]|nr:hypothetical protein [Parachlamydiales bacterium]